MVKGYGPMEWREDLRRCLLLAGIKQQAVVFVLTDTQITFDSMMEDVCGLLNAGDVPNLFGPEELEQIYRCAYQSFGVVQ